MPSKVRFPSIPLVWLVTILFAIVEAVLWWMYHFKWYDRESIGFLATVAAGAFGLFAYLKGVEEKRSEAAGRYIERWNSPHFRPSVDSTRLIVEGTKHCSDCSTDRALRDNVVTVLNFFEEIAIGVLSRNADEDRVKDFFGAAIPRGYEAFEPFILDVRRQEKDREYFKKIQKLVERWTDTRRTDI